MDAKIVYYLNNNNLARILILLYNGISIIKEFVLFNNYIYLVKIVIICPI